MSEVRSYECRECGEMEASRSGGLCGACEDCRDEAQDEQIRQLIYAALIEMPGVADVSSYKDVGMLTMNDGFVITMKNGLEYQLTVVESTRRPPQD